MNHVPTNAFFAKKREMLQATNLTLVDVENQIKKQNYRFLIQKYREIEQDFQNLFQHTKDTKDDKTLLYNIYCSASLLQYYKQYNKPDKIETYRNILDGLLKQMNSNNSETLKELVQQSTRPKYSPGVMTSTTSIQQVVGLANVMRMEILLGKFLVSSSLEIGHATHLLDGLELLLNTRLDVSALNQLNMLFNSLSVLVFFVRLSINTALACKHMFETDGDNSAVPFTELFQNEFQRRYWLATNDIVWGVVNGLCNFSSHFGISAVTSNTVMVVFMCFDIAWLLQKLYIDYSNFCTIGERYASEKKDGLPADIMDKQLQQLQHDWQVNLAKTQINLTAATLLASGYYAATTITTPLAIPVAFFVATVAISLYLSAEAYGQWVDAELNVKEASVPNEQLEAKVSEKSQLFLYSMLKHSIFPSLVLAVFSMSTPAALLLSVGLYCFDGYMTAENAKDLLPAPSP